MDLVTHLRYDQLTLLFDKKQHFIHTTKYISNYQEGLYNLNIRYFL